MPRYLLGSDTYGVTHAFWGPGHNTVGMCSSIDDVRSLCKGPPKHYFITCMRCVDIMVRFV